MSTKPFLHDLADFRDLIVIVADHVEVAEALVEKDYWVTHTLWSLVQSGLTVRFKGGTSLSKGFDMIERFSEDIDIKVEADGLPRVSSWTSKTKGALASRKRFFDALLARIVVPGADVSRLEPPTDTYVRNEVFKVEYGGHFLEGLPAAMRAFVQIEVGSARVDPGTPRKMTSWVHQYVNQKAANVATACIDNQTEVHCVFPEVTLLEKIEAIGRCFEQGKPAPGFVRHYEDAAKILQALSMTSEELKSLLETLVEQGDIKRWPEPSNPAFVYEASSQAWTGLQQAWQDIAPMYWGTRVELPQCAKQIRDLLRSLA